MMKTKRINYTLLLLLIFAGIMASCVKDDDFDTPDSSINPPDIPGDTITVADAINMYENENDPQYSFSGSEEYMVGYVVSSDEAGNFYQEMVIQDKPENPTAGVKLMILANPLFTKYEVGRKIYVELDGFTMGDSNGVVALGVPEEGSDFINKAPQGFATKIIRSEVKAELEPLELEISDIESGDYDNLFVKLDSLQFPADISIGENAQTYAAEDGEEYDADRVLESCENGDEITMITSSFADFKASKLPQGQGSIEAIVSKTYNGSSYRLKINDPTYIKFDEDRCDGEDPDDPSDPGDGDVEIVDMPYLEDFESMGEDEDINSNGLTNADVEGGRKWRSRDFDGSNVYAEVSAFNASGAVESWLVTPGVDLSGADEPILSFGSKDGFSNGEALTVYVSTDFDGNVQNATWDEITDQADISTGSDDYPDDFVDSGNIDLSSYNGETVFVAFKYEGDGDGTTTTYQLDDISIKESGDEDGDGGDNGDDGDGTPPSEDAVLVFPGADFEDWSTFLDGLNSFGLQDYATQGEGEGRDGSNSLHIETDGADNNDYVFTAEAAEDLPEDYSQISFYIKGSSDKSVSINVYDENGDYSSFNLTDLDGDKSLGVDENNQYIGTIDTDGEWALVTLDISSLDVNITDTSTDILALKIGKEADYDLHFDNFTIE